MRIFNYNDVHLKLVKGICKGCYFEKIYKKYCEAPYKLRSHCLDLMKDVQDHFEEISEIEYLMLKKKGAKNE